MMNESLDGIRQLMLETYNFFCVGSPDDKLSDEQNALVESASEMLYGLIHARYILTTKGMSAMVKSFPNSKFIIIICIL